MMFGDILTLHNRLCAMYVKESILRYKLFPYLSYCQAIPVILYLQLSIQIYVVTENPKLGRVVLCS